MQRIENVRSSTFTSDGSYLAVLDIQVSAMSDLPALGGIFCGAVVQAGTMAHVVRKGVMLTIDDDGTWYNSYGMAANAASDTSTLASPAVIGKSAPLDQVKSTLTADEPEQTETDEHDTESEVTEDEH